MEVLVAWRAGLWLWAGFGGLGIWGSLWDRSGACSASVPQRQHNTAWMCLSPPRCSYCMGSAVGRMVPPPHISRVCLLPRAHHAVGSGTVPVGPQWVAVSQHLSSPQTGLAHGGIQNLSFKKSAHDFVRSFS